MEQRETAEYTGRVNPSHSGSLPNPGESFAGKYTIGRVLGQGGVGVVFEAFHQRLNQRVAIKILRAEVRKSAEWLTRFDREARASVKLRSPNVARVFDVDSTPDGTPYMVMELLEGWTLNEEINARGPLPIAEAVGYILEACSAMSEAHALGIVHRDLTPANLFLSNVAGRRVVKVLDFGISKVADERVNVTTTDAAFGTPQYVSPEQIRSTAHVDPRTDIWSMSVILFQALSGITPFEGKTASAVVASVLMDRPKSLQALRPDLPKGLVTAVMKGLEKNLSDRYQSIEELAAAVAPFGPPGFSLQSAGPHSERPGLMLTGPLTAPPANLASLSPSTVGTDADAAALGFRSTSKRTWIIAGALAASVVVITALLIGLGGSTDTAQSAAAGSSAAAAPVASPSASASEEAAIDLGELPEPDEANSASGGRKSKSAKSSAAKKSAGEASAPPPASTPKTPAKTGGDDALPLHL